MKKVINFAFVGLILCGLLLGLARTVFFPKEINYYENRYANRAALPMPGSYADGTFQDQLEAALGDQTPFAERFKARYNDLSSKLTKALLKPVLENGRYYRVGDVQLFSDYLTYQTRDLEKLRPTLEERAANYNAIFAAHPDTEFYVCYIEKDTDINFETGERVYADDLLFSMLDFLGVEKERTRVEWVSAAEGAKFAATMNEFVKTITELGENRRLEDLRCKE